MNTHHRQSRLLLVGWGVLRVPAVLIAGWSWAGTGGLEWALAGNAAPLEWAFDVASTPAVRFACGLGVIGVIGAWVSVTARLSARIRYAATVAVAVAVFAGGFRVTGQSWWLSVMPAVLVATNLAPLHLMGTRWRRVTAFAFGVVPVLPEVCFGRHYIDWLRGVGIALSEPATVGVAGMPVLPGLLLATAWFSLALSGPRLVWAEQALRMSAHATVEDAGDMNWIQRDRTGRFLFATGHGLNRIRRYMIDGPRTVAVESDVETAGAQDFALGVEHDELYVYNSRRRHLLILDAGTLALKRAIPLPGLSRGDSWTIWDAATNAILVVSENDGQEGTPFLLVDRSTGLVLDQRQEDAGNLIKHPTQPLAYLGFFRRAKVLKAYNLADRGLVAEAATDGHISRMTFWGAANELLVSAPSRSRVLRFDAATLRLKGQFKVPFGGRGLAVDERRGLLFSASLATGRLSVIRLDDGRLLGSAYLGPWLRTVALDPDRQHAYVSSRFGLYSFDYRGAF